VKFHKSGAFAADRRRRESAVSSTCEPPGREATRMRRAVVFAAAAAVLAPTAAAGSFAGVTVAKDSKRKSVVVVVVVVSGRSVRTVRAGAGYARFRVGQRIVVTASRLADGTYRASDLRAAGHSRRVRAGMDLVIFRSASGSRSAAFRARTATFSSRSTRATAGSRPTGPVNSPSTARFPRAMAAFPFDARTG
jgi:hypothetical protein